MKMTNDEFKQVILQKIGAVGRVSVPDLSSEFGVSGVTIRKYLNDLAEKGLIKRTHGGAMRIEHAAAEPALSVLEQTNIEVKKAIAKSAYRLLEDGDSLMLDASSTTRQLAHIIKAENKKKLTVITSSILIACELAECEHVELIQIGGYVRSSIFSVMGPMAISAIGKFHVDKTFIGTTGIDLDAGFTTQNLFECEVKRSMVEAASQSFVLADKSKMNCVALGMICPISRADYIITDKGMPRDFIEEIEKAGPEVIVADGA